AENGIVYIRRKRSGHRQGAERSADKKTAPSFLGRLIGGATCHDCRLYIDFLHERAQLAVIDDALEKFHAFSSLWRFALEKKIVEANRGAAKSVRLDDVRAGFEITPADFVNEIGLGKEKNFEAALQIL